MGLKAGQAKMSKSDPDSAVFMEESALRTKRLSFSCPSCVAEKSGGQTNGHQISTYGFVWKCWVNIPNEIAI